MNIVIIDDHQIVADALKVVLQTNAAIKEIRTFLTAKAFLDSIGNWLPDIVIADLSLPGMTGMELIETIQKKPLPHHPRVVILSSTTDVQTIKQAIRLGASGYLSKGVSVAELQEAIDAIHNGEQYISKSLRNSLINSVFVDEQVVLHLSPREKEVLALICSGHTIKEAASVLKLSTHTIQGYHKNIMKKFKVSRTADLIVFAIQKGLYNPSLDPNR